MKYLFSESILASQVRAKDGPKNLLKTIFLSGRHAKHVKLAGKPLSEDSPASLWWGSCTYKGHVLHFLPEQFIDIIHPLIVNHLSQPLNGHLSTVLIICRHVNVINENDDSCVPHPS